MKGKIINLIIMLLSFIFMNSCSDVNLNGHYHLEWGNNSQQFQVWNIENNKMVINRPNCLENDNKCFSSQLIFKGGKVQINPWVDSNCEYNYTLENNGTIILFNEYNRMKLVPQNNCLLNEEYFENKTKSFTRSFLLLEDIMTGVSVFPSEYKNELIILQDNILIFNNSKIEHIRDIPKVKSKKIWLHIDKRIKLRKILPIINEIHSKGYDFSFSVLAKNENKEQIILLNRNIESIRNINNSYEIEICDYCEKYKVEKVDNLLEIELLGDDKFVFENDTTNLFQIRNSIVRFIRQNRNTRLHTKIQFIIPSETSIEDYILLIDELKFVHIELSDIIIYNGKDDKDTEAIKNDIIDRTKEFPLRIKEIIK